MKNFRRYFRKDEGEGDGVGVGDRLRVDGREDDPLLVRLRCYRGIPVLSRPGNFVRYCGPYRLRLWITPVRPAHLSTASGPSLKSWYWFPLEFRTVSSR